MSRALPRSCRLTRVALYLGIPVRGEGPHLRCGIHVGGDLHGEAHLVDATAAAALHLKLGVVKPECRGDRALRDG
jgi:hypothetical protein